MSAAPTIAEPIRCSASFPYPTRHVDTAAGRLAYFDERPADAKGPTLVFVHGLGGDFTHFEHVAPAFAANHRVIGLDLPGCGGSEKHRSRHTLASHARAVAELLRVLGVERAVLVGHSAGGQVSAAAALLAPERVERLVLINSAGMRSYLLPVRLAARVVFQPRVLKALLAPSALKLLARVFHQENEHTSKFRRGAMGRPREPLLTELCKVMSDLMPDLLRPTVRDSAPRLTMPALIVWGDRDRLVPIRVVRRAAAHFPRARLEVIHGCGHMPIIEQPQRMVELLQGFLG